jgi:hypothetical protein
MEASAGPALSSEVPVPCAYNQLVSKKRVALVACIAALTALTAVLTLGKQADRAVDVAILRDKVPISASEHPDLTDFWEPVYGGMRIYTFEGAFETVASQLARDLEAKGWEPGTVHPNATHWSFKGRQVKLFRGRTVLTGTSRTFQKDLDREWVSVDYEWPSQSSIPKSVFYGLIGRTPTEWP